MKLTCILGLVLLMFGCGGEGDPESNVSVHEVDGVSITSVDLEENGDLGTLEQPIVSNYTIPAGAGNNKNNSLGVAALTGVPGAQANVGPGAPASQQYLVPYTVSWTMRFTGFSAPDQANLETAFGTGENVLVSLGTGYSYTHTAGNAKIRVLALADDGGSSAASIDSFFSVSCSPGSVLSEPGGSVPGIYSKISSANDACSIGVRYSKIVRLIAGATTQRRVMSHGASWALAGIGGLGDTATVYSTLVTSRSVNTALIKNSMPTTQACLASHWSGAAQNTYELSASSFCNGALPIGY